MKRHRHARGLAMSLSRLAPLFLGILIGVSASTGCNKDTDQVPVEQSSPTTGTPAANAKDAAATADATNQAGASVSPRPAYDVKTKCTDSCLLLMDTPFAEVANGGYCKLCAAFDEMACELDWPSSDVPPCSHYDFMRNCIYAGYGRAFTSPEYKEAFAKRRWYKTDPNYDDKAVPATAKANARHLRKLVKDGVCSPD